MFNKAQYFVGDGNGCELILEIDYFNNKYLIIGAKSVNVNVENEARQIAMNLLNRKHGKNFARKFK